MIRLLSEELSVKDSLVSKQPTTILEFKTRLDVYHYRNNYEFEGNLLKQSFMDNYGQLIKMYEQLKEESALDKQELAHASAMAGGSTRFA